MNVLCMCVARRINDAAARVVDRLDAVLSALVHCSGVACRNPYSLLHPGGGVRKFSMVRARTSGR